MEKNIKYLVLPDVHARDFWREPVKEVLENSDAHIIFLGDYIDPYGFEWDDDIDYKKLAVETFEEIIGLKKKYPERITLLLGNHDGGYCIGDYICSCRHDYANGHKIEKLFNENRDLFQLAEQTEIGGKKIIFSHAGIFKEWAKLLWKEDAEADDFNVVDRLNNAWLTDDGTVLHTLGIYDRYRGWGGVKYGSPVWADIRSWADAKPEETYGFNIVGHTMLNGTPVIFDTIACLDCQKAFYLDDEGNIRDYATDEIQEGIKHE